MQKRSGTLIVALKILLIALLAELLVATISSGLIFIAVTKLITVTAIVTLIVLEANIFRY